MSNNNTEVAETATVATPAASDIFTSEVTSQGQYTAEDISRARTQEKEKLYPAMEKMKEELAQLKAERDAEAAKEADRRAQRVARDAEAAKRKELDAEQELGFKELLHKKEAELQAEIQAERAEREKALALLDRERQFQELQAYRHERVELERENIIPELVDLIKGDSKDDIEQSIAALKSKSAQIFESVAQASQQTRKDMVGARVTAPASGPLDNDPASNPLSSSDITNMSMADYSKNRAKLLGTAGNNRGQGLFG